MDFNSGGSTYFGPAKTLARRALKISRAQCVNILGFESGETPVSMEAAAVIFNAFVLRVARVNKHKNQK
jgi:hypothetical protein